MRPLSCHRSPERLSSLSVFPILCYVLSFEEAQMMAIRDILNPGLVPEDQACKVCTPAYKDLVDEILILMVPILFSPKWGYKNCPLCFFSSDPLYAFNFMILF